MLHTLPARCIDAVRIHRTTFEMHDGVPGVRKERRPGMSAIITCGNWFLRMADSGIRLFPSVKDWQKFEAQNFALCHPSRRVSTIKSNALFFERLPGRDLRMLAGESKLTELALECAARELRRVHALRDPLTGQPWSHGDPHLANFLFDADTERCHLIDFETVSSPSRSAAWRHANDLLVFCLELLGRNRGIAPVSHAAAFVRAYDDPDVESELLLRLKPPRGFARILWQTRTEYLAGRALNSRLGELRRMLS